MRIGPIQLAIPFCQAGLAGYSDRAMRLVARRRGCPYAVTEALLDVVMLAGGHGLKKSIDINDEDHPVAGQVIGSEPHEVARAACILAGFGYDVIDLNFACPVKKIKNRARGGYMLGDALRAIDILKSVRDAVESDVPTTLSLRRAFDDSPESLDQFHEVLQAAWEYGYSAVRVHGRTVEQKYAGKSDWEFLRRLKQQFPQRTILGSGDVFCAQDAVRMYLQTGVDIVWIARGAIGNPWIFRQAEALLQRASAGGDEEMGRRGDGEVGSRIDEGREEKKGREPFSSSSGLGTQDSALLPPTIAEQRDALQEHFALAMQIHGEAMAGRRMRKMGIKYSRFHPDHARVKGDFIQVQSLRDWTGVLDHWYATDAPGVWPAADATDEVNGSGEQSCEGE